MLRHDRGWILKPLMRNGELYQLEVFIGWKEEAYDISWLVEAPSRLASVTS